MIPLLIIFLYEHDRKKKKEKSMNFYKNQNSEAKQYFLLMLFITYVNITYNIRSQDDKITKTLISHFELFLFILRINAISRILPPSNIHQSLMRLSPL